MEIKSLLKEWRIIFLLFFILISVGAMGPSWVSTDDGYTIAVTGLEDNLGTEFTGGTQLLLSLDSNKTGEGLRTEAQDVADVLRLRANGIQQVKDPKVNVVNIDGWKVRVTAQVGDTDESLRDLITEEGKFEARVTLPVRDSKEFALENTYRFENTNSTVSVYQDSEQLGTYSPGDRFTLKGEEHDVDFVYTNYSENTANLEVVAYTGSEIADVRGSETRATGDSTITFPITLETQAAERYGIINDNFDSTLGGQNRLIHEDGDPVFIRFYLDEEMKAELSILSSPGDSTSTSRSIQISRDDISSARQEAERIQTVLKSGSLPTTVSVESETSLGSSLGDEFMKVSIVSIGLALVAVALLVFARYRRPKIVLPLFLTGSSEVLIMLGLWFSTIGELTLSAVAGIIAAVGTGVDDQIIITDESDREVVRSWKQRMKQAFFVIFTSAASTIGAMTPIISPSFANLMVGLAGVGLMGYTFFTRGTNPHYVAIGALAAVVAVVSFPIAGTGDALVNIRGFATTTIIGILIGITITRPAYSKILEHLD